MHLPGTNAIIVSKYYTEIQRENLLLCMRVSIRYIVPAVDDSWLGGVRGTEFSKPAMEGQEGGGHVLDILSREMSDL